MGSGTDTGYRAPGRREPGGMLPTDAAPGKGTVVRLEVPL
jgi:hypothetical protein